MNPVAHDMTCAARDIGNLLMNGTMYNNITSYSHTVCKCLGLDHPNRRQVDIPVKPKFHLTDNWYLHLTLISTV